MQKEKICTAVKQLYLFIRKHISFQAEFCMLIVISQKKKHFLNVHLSTLKWSQRSSSATIRTFYKLCFFFYLVQQQDTFETLKKGNSLSEGLNYHVYH